MGNYGLLVTHEMEYFVSRLMLQDFTRVAFRWIFGISFLSLAFWTATFGFRNENYSLMFGSVPLFIIGIGIIWKQLFSLAIQPFMLFIESIYLPGGRLSKPVLNLKLPAYYFNKGRYYEALEEYKKVLKYYPDEVEAYERLIWMHYEIFNEVGEAKKLIRKAKHRHLVLDERVILAMERK